ncbi:hypothetical protein BC829DRAFT_396383 [Chytridium lagenaria]|nr:hypothetical protein BC829DRAFT_396383 [Chytridium lagenaria]
MASEGEVVEMRLEDNKIIEIVNSSSGELAKVTSSKGNAPYSKKRWASVDNSSLLSHQRKLSSNKDNEPVLRRNSADSKAPPKHHRSLTTHKNSADRSGYSSASGTVHDSPSIQSLKSRIHRYGSEGSGSMDTTRSSDGTVSKESGTTSSLHIASSEYLSTNNGVLQSSPLCVDFCPDEDVISSMEVSTSKSSGHIHDIETPPAAIPEIRKKPYTSLPNPHVIASSRNVTRLLSADRRRQNEELCMPRIDSGDAADSGSKDMTGSLAVGHASLNVQNILFDPNIAVSEKGAAEEDDMNCCFIWRKAKSNKKNSS